MSLLLVLSFLLGAVPVGYLIGKCMGVDIREKGSGNIGATNAERVLGRKAGIATLIADILKGAIPVLIALSIKVDISAWPEQILPAACGFLAVLGHCFSPFLAFKGGKGVATSLGVFLALAPLAALLALAAFLLTAKLSGYVSLGSIIGAATLPAAIYTQIGGPYSGSALWASILIAALVIGKHRQNIRRLREGTELHLSAKKTNCSAQAPQE